MTTIRFIIGYFIGMAIFLFLIPLFLLYLSRNVDDLFGIFIFLPLWIRLALSIPLFLLGALFAGWSNYFLLMVGKGGPSDIFNYAISPRSRNLVTTGPYKFVRHPMVFGMLAMYLGLTIFLFSLGCIIFWIILTLLVRYYLHKTEEKRLEKDFGKAYHVYKSTVPMLFPNIFRSE